MPHYLDINDTKLAMSINDLLSRPEEDFVHCAYQSILRRPPDPVGYAASLEQLKNGVSKLAILKQMRFSPEGNQSNSLIEELDEAIQSLISESERLMHASKSTQSIYFKFKTATATYARKVR